MHKTDNCAEYLCKTEVCDLGIFYPEILKNLLCVTFREQSYLVKTSFKIN